MPAGATGVAHYLGMIVGRSHARQLGVDGRRSWYHEVATHRTRNIDAPSWLWQSVVELVAEHERAYLEHCRRFALEMNKKPSRDEQGPPGL